MQLTKAQTALLSGIAMLLVSSLATALSGLRPFLANGTINYSGLIIYIVSTALPTIGTALLAYVLTHEPQVLQALSDTAVQDLHLPQETIDMLRSYFGEIKGLIQGIQQQPIIVNTPASVTHATIQAQPIVAPIQQTPQAPVQGAPLQQKPLAQVVPASVPSAPVAPTVPYDNPLTGMEVTSPTLPIVPKQQ